MATAAGTFLSCGLAVTRAAIHHGAQRALIPGYARARAAVLQTLTSAAAHGALRDALPTIAPLLPKCVDDEETCAYSTTATITFSKDAIETGQSCSIQNSCLREQHNLYVDEGRISARISVSVIDKSGEQLAAQTSVLLLRTLRAPPYVMVSGARDMRFDATKDPVAISDDGGMRANIDPCATGVPGTSADTAIHVVYRRAGEGSCTSGEHWRDTALSPQAPERWTH